MRALVFEGDPEEVARAIKALGMSQGSVALPAPPSSGQSGNSQEAGEEAGRSGKVVTSVTFALKVLGRRGLAPNQKKLLIEIYNAGEAGILGSELVTKLGLSQSQFRGVTGAWGRRVVNTPGHDGESYFFDWEWDYDAGSYRYWLPPAVREAIKRELIDRR